MRLHIPRLDARRFVHNILMWSRALVPVIALLAAIASAVRTYATTFRIYQNSGIDERTSVAVSLAFTVAVEGAIFTLALAREWQQIKWRQAHKKRHIVTLPSIWHGIKVRIGKAEPLTYDQMPESNNLVTLMIWIAFSYALISNVNMGIRPLIAELGSSNLQTFFAGLLNASANIQISFIVDLASVLFPPFMALVAGHQTARFASEFASSMNRLNAAPTVKAERAKVAAETLPESPAKRSTKTARERVIEYLNEHPEQTNQHEVARQTRVSVGTVNAVFKDRLLKGSAERISGNGSYHSEAK